jgi:sugar lactone lactonase YvrE
VDDSGTIYVSDTWNDTIREVTPSGLVTTLAGSVGQSGSTDGPGSAARFYAPQNVAVDGSGNLYVADPFNNTIRKVSPSGVVTTLAGSAGRYGSTDGIGSVARFNKPSGVAADTLGNLVVGDADNNTIRKVTATGVVTTLAGSAGRRGSADGTGSAARFNQPNGVAVDAAGNIYVADMGNNTIRKITPDAAVTTIGGTVGVMCAADGVGSAALFASPVGIAVDSWGNLYVADTDNSRICKGTPVLPSPPQFQPANPAGNAMLLDWTAVAGFHYQLQYKTNLAQPDWMNLGGPMGATNNAMSASDSTGPDRQRFYRVVLFP